MRYHTLSQIEAGFRNDAAAFLKPFSVPVPNEALTLEGLLYKPGRSGYFHAVEHPKQRIVLHFTAGNLRSDMQSLTMQNRHVSVAFVIARDGTIYQLFPSACWSGHLGPGIGNKGTANAQDKTTIGIELSNYGYLVPRDGNLETIYSRVKDPQTEKISPADLYCSQDDTSAYRKIDQPFRDQLHYASFTPQQMESTIILLRYLTAKFNIPRAFLPEDKRYTATNDVLGFKGIVSHVNYRTGGKWDIGPAFDWDHVISNVQSPVFTPSQPAVRALGLAAARVALGSEAAIAALFPQEERAVEIAEAAGDNDNYNPNDFEAAAETTIAPATGRLYALLVGINNYDRVRKLHGCIHDVQQVEKYLSERTPFTCDIKLLTDADATRQNLALQFDQHLGKAQPGDTVLFYYSGHGTLEDASPVWDETDQRLECLVCHDGGATKAADFLLTDKELRHLIAALYQETKAHIVTIFDCCHSGDNTRGVLEMAARKGQEAAVRMITDESRLSAAFPERDWNDFIFGSTVKKEDVAAKKPGTFLPEGVHIQMAACESDQSAMEVGGEGVFTKKLLEVLDTSNGNLSYNTLRNRIRQYLRFSFEQTPRIYAGANAGYLLAAGFLNRNINGTAAVAEATYNQDKGWQLNVGAIHGVDNNTSVSITDTTEPGKVYTATITAVYIDYSSIDMDGDPSKEQAHKALVQGLMTESLLLDLETRNIHPQDLELLTAEVLAKSGGHIELGAAGNNGSRHADYTLQVRGGEAVITWPGDPYRPLVRPLKLAVPADYALLSDTLKHIARWHFIRQLQNSRIPQGFPEHPLQIEVTRLYNDNSEEQLDIVGGAVTLEYEQVNHQWKGAIRINLSNTTGQDLYVAALYLDRDFKVFPDFLPQRVQKLEKGSGIALGLKGAEKISFRLDDVMREYNWPAGIAGIKFIVSSEEFNTEALVMGALPAPYVLADRLRESRHAAAATKQLDTTDEAPIVLSGWMTQSLGLIFKNPMYNQPDPAMLKDLLAYEETAGYAAGLYHDLKPNEHGSATDRPIQSIPNQ